MILNDKQISQLAVEEKMIHPFVDSQVRAHSDYTGWEPKSKRVISYGVSSFGYDARIDRVFKVFSPIHAEVVDPKNFDERAFVDVETDVLTMPPHSFVLGRTVERIKMPDDVVALCVGKSTYARCGLTVNVTPLEPGWEGVVTVEISNTTPLPARIYAGEGIMQIVFHRGERPQTTYADRKGKYQGQDDVTPAKV